MRPFLFTFLIGACLYGGYGATKPEPTAEQATEQLTEDNKPQAVEAHLAEAHCLDNTEGW